MEKKFRMNQVSSDEKNSSEEGLNPHINDLFLDLLFWNDS